MLHRQIHETAVIHQLDPIQDAPGVYPPGRKVGLQGIDLATGHAFLDAVCKPCRFACSNDAVCGRMQDDYPMPFADTGLAAPNDLTNSAGLFLHTGGVVELFA